MDQQMEKGKPLSKEETKALLDMIENSKVITTRHTNATNNKLKNEEWARIALKFNSTVAIHRRSAQQLRLKWENLKKNARKRNTRIRMSHIETGGEEYIPPDPVLDRVSSILGNAMSGSSASFESDRDPNLTGCGSSGGEGSDGDGMADLEDDSMQEPDILITDTDPNIPCKLSKRTQDDRNIAINHYYNFKRKCLKAKMKGILLSNKKLQLENKKLQLEIKLLEIDLETKKSKY